MNISEMKRIYSKSVRSFETILEMVYPIVWSLKTTDVILSFSSICEPNIYLFPNIQKLVSIKKIGAKDIIPKLTSGKSTVNFVGSL